jgi:hypothetical protein
MRALVARDLADAKVEGLSTDRRFATGRRKRNVIDYTRSHVATETEANEVVEKATEFYDVVEAWIDSKFPNLKR